MIYKSQLTINILRILAFGEEAMLKTITIGTCITVQGTFVQALTNGKIAVQVGERVFEGTPVGS
jgi:hypothetical protein